MIDFHAHLLPALDDGAIDLDESIFMARALKDFGYTSVCSITHCIKGCYDFTPQMIREATLMLQADLDNVGIELDLWPGMEYMLDECFMEHADDLLPLGATRLVLCEAPPQAHPQVVQQGLEMIVSKGFVPLVAHPERTEYFYEILSARNAEQEIQGTEDFETESDEGDQRNTAGFLKKIWPFTSRAPRPAFRPVDKSHPTLPGATLFHANLGSFTGFYGSAVQRRAYELLKSGVYTALASDLHDSRAALQVLVRDKIELNPLLKKLAEFDGTTDALQEQQEAEKQGDLF
jgi:protein-tyrosine phosphatase